MLRNHGIREKLDQIAQCCLASRSGRFQLLRPREQCGMGPSVRLEAFVTMLGEQGLLVGEVPYNVRHDLFQRRAEGFRRRFRLERRIEQRVRQLEQLTVLPIDRRLAAFISFLPYQTNDGWAAR